MRYRSLIIDDEKPPATAADISALEECLGAELPADYTAFLRTTNGGHLDYEVPVAFTDGHTERMGFCSFHEVREGGSWETNPFELEQAREAEGYPSRGVLPIACDGGGSSLFLDLRAGCSVVAFVHGLPAWTGLRQSDTLVTIADSFNDYLSKLFISDEYVAEFIEEFDKEYGDPAFGVEWLDTGNSTWREVFRDKWNAKFPDHQI